MVFFLLTILYYVLMYNRLSYCYVFYDICFIFLSLFLCIGVGYFFTCCFVYILGQGVLMNYFCLEKQFIIRQRRLYTIFFK